MHHGRLERVVRQQLRHLKEVIAVGPVEVAAQHAAILETDGETRTGMGHFARASRGVLCRRSQRDGRV